MGLFRSRSDVLAGKLKVRTRQLETMNKLSTLRDQTSNSEEFLKKAVGFIAQELASRFVAVVLKDGEQLTTAASTMPEFAQQHNDVILALANGGIAQGNYVCINNTRPHMKLRAAGIACALAKPLRFKQQFIGAIIVFRMKRLPFRQRSLHTISTLAEQLPPALDYVKAGENVTQKNKELKIIYEIDKVKEKFGKDTQTLIDALAEQVQKHTGAKTAFVVLSDAKTNTSKFAATGNASAHKKDLLKFAEDAIAQGEMIERDVNVHLKEGVCVPVTIGDDHAAFGMANSGNGGFSDEDKRILSVIARQSDSALFEDREKKKLKDVFSRYVSGEVLDILLKDPEKNALRSERHEVTMLFSDLRGFTSLSEKIAPEAVVTMLNDYFSIMTDIILKNKGTLDKFVGDEIVAMFGAPVFFEDHAKRAATTAIEMQEAFRALQAKWKRQGLPEVGMGIGMDSGNVVVGNIGGERRVDYTAIGDHVNTAARLCSQAADNQVLMTQNTYDQITKSISAKELAPLHLKGKAQPIKVYNALSVR